MPTDITLAVDDGARRMTYSEIADMRRISVASAERLVRRKRWVRTLGNDGVVRVQVPLAEAKKPPQRTPAIRRRTESGQDAGQGDMSAVRTAEMAVSALTTQLRRADAEIDRLRHEASDAAAAEQIARDEAAGLRAELDARREWGLARRLRWALGRKR